MKTKLWPIQTGQKQVPWVWMVMLAGPWAAKMYFEQISIVAVTFKLREFVSAPLIITAVGSFNTIFNIFVGASCNYSSDRVWTRWGRRRPFLIVGWSTIAIGCLVLPEINTLWLLVSMLFFYEMLRDVDGPYESFMNEVVPPHQRGTHNATITFVRQVITAVFFAVLVGQWDNVVAIPGLGEIGGQRLIFWTGSALALTCVVFVIFGLHETPPAALPPPRAPLNLGNLRITLREFLHNVFGRRQWWALYAVGIAQMIFWIGFGNLTPLLFTEQWGFSKQDYGYVLAIGTPFTLLVCLPLGGWLADRFDRPTMFKGLTAAITCAHLVFFLFLKLRPGDAPPSFGIVVTYWLLHTGIGNIGVVCTVSMMFDFVPRNCFGTVCSGIGIVRGIASIFISNGIGLWVTTVTALTPSRSVTGEDTRYDYESGFIYLVFCGVIATGIAFWFNREIARGRLSPRGVIEAEQSHSESPLSC